MKYADFNDNELIYMVKENEEVLSIMLRKYEPLFRKLSFSFVEKHKYKGLDVEDLVQQCRITFCYAIDKYDVNNETRFYTYLIVCLRRAIMNYSRCYLKKPDVYYMEEETYYDIKSNEEEIDDILIFDDFLKLIKNFSLELDFFDTCVFELRLNNFSYKEISILLAISVKKVDNVLLRIRKKLENYIELA